MRTINWNCTSSSYLKKRIYTGEHGQSWVAKSLASKVLPVNWALFPPACFVSLVSSDVPDRKSVV